MRALTLIVVMLLASCQTTEPAVTPAPQVIHVPTTSYVPVPKKLTEPCPVAHGDLSEVVIVARKRKASLEKCNGKLDAIRAIQGTGVEPVKP